ncbi:type VI secretion system tube protein Hcp [Hydrogenophaga sp.]|uniref:type VI secretion system tube protein Hcp n=1 Tax=Hydrogenophaga sp. TaxID=1904254 RepID=UPI0025C32C8A|nr:type VI secretion system tube protein Hcp [Hydrogenophaga sp.]
MAESISLTISSNGENIPGDSTVSSLGRENTIEVLSLEQTLFRPFDRASLRATGRTIYTPLKFSKRLDRATPSLRQSLAQNSVMVGEFRWFRPNPEDGSTEHVFTLGFTGSRVTKSTLRLPDTLSTEASNLPPMEDIEMVLGFVSLEWVSGDVFLHNNDVDA